MSTYVQPTTIKYEIIIGASQKGGDVVSDGCGYTYSFIQTMKAQEFGGALFVFASNFRVFTPLSSKLRGLRFIFNALILKKVSL